jgi:FtsP/CotA-like multicopper oxidase with cupredoxin domain
MDGVHFPDVRTIPAKADGDNEPQLVLASANRTEFLIKASLIPGLYRIRQFAQNQQFLSSPAKIIAEIEVTGEAKDMALPNALPIPSRKYPLITPNEIKRVRQVEFRDQVPAVINTVAGSDFLINNAIYHEQEVPTVVKRGEVEEWRISWSATAVTVVRKAIHSISASTPLRARSRTCESGNTIWGFPR